MKKEFKLFLFALALRFSLWILPDGNLKTSLREWVLKNKKDLTE